MSDEFGGNIHTISDEEGNVYRLEHLDTIELDGQIYLAFVPADVDPEDEKYGFIFMKSEKGDDGDDYLTPVDDEGPEIDRVYEAFMEDLYGDEDQE